MFWEHVLNSVCASGASSLVPLQMFRGTEINHGKKKKLKLEVVMLVIIGMKFQIYLPDLIAGVGIPC